MIPGFGSTVFVTTALLGALTFLGGCATTGMDRAKKTTNMMQTVEDDYRKASEQINVVDASLESLISPAQTDRRVAYRAYDKNVDRMETLGKQIEKHSDDMKSRGTEYFAEWDSNEYSNPEIREISERRRVEMREIYAKIPEASIGVKGALKSYLTDIGDIRKYLSNDLTPQGVEAIKPIAEKAVVDGGNLKTTVNGVLTAIGRVRTEMVQGGANK